MTPMTASDRRRRARHMLPGFGVQLVTVRYLGIFLNDPLEVPAGVIGSVAGQRASRIRRASGAAPGVGPRCPAWMSAAVTNSRPVR